jgi:hypothetical protein
MWIKYFLLAIVIFLCCIAFYAWGFMEGQTKVMTLPLDMVTELNNRLTK